VLALMAGLVDQWHFGTIHDPRGASAQRLAESLRRVSPSAVVHCHDDMISAWRHAVADQGDDDALLGFGSFYSVGDILSLY